jgi:hypothetical protein
MSIDATWDMVFKRVDDEKTELRHPCEDKSDRIIRSTRAERSSVRNGNEKTFLSVLVLERLGDLTPSGIPLEAIKFVWPLAMHASELPLLCRPDVHEI